MTWPEAFFYSVVAVAVAFVLVFAIVAVSGPPKDGDDQ